MIAGALKFMKMKPFCPVALLIAKSGKTGRIAVMMVNHVISMVAYSTTFRYIF